MSPAAVPIVRRQSRAPQFRRERPSHLLDDPLFHFGIGELGPSPEILEEYKRVSAELAVKYPDMDIKRILDLIVVHSVMCSPAALPQRVCPAEGILLSGRFCSDPASVRRTLPSWMIGPSGDLPPTGQVIGVDMTPEMVEKARENSRKAGQTNVEFRLGEIEHLPVADASVDAIISNCVINLSLSKAEVFEEAYRVLRPGGRVMISDIMLTGELPDQVRGSLSAYAGCIAGAIRKEEYLRLLSEAGFHEVRVVQESAFEVSETESEAYAKSISRSFGIAEKTVQEAMRAISSVCVYGVKSR